GNYDYGHSHGWNWQSPTGRFDVNADSVVSPSDALILIDDYNTWGEHVLSGYRQSGDYYLDVSGDLVASVLDIHQLIDKINGGTGDYNPPGRSPTAPYSSD